MIVFKYLASDVEHINFDKGLEFVCEKVVEIYEDKKEITPEEIRYLLYLSLIYGYKEVIDLCLNFWEEPVKKFFKYEHGVKVLKSVDENIAKIYSKYTFP